MFCSWCHKETADTPCDQCGRDPKLNGQFTLVSMLGHGAAGQTWEAKGDDGTVAIKELSFRRLADMKQLELFEREAAVLRELDHPGIPEYLDDFIIEDDKHMSFYLVQSFIRGEPLDARSLTDEEEVIEMMNALCDILLYLETRRPPVVHRDIKPSNIIETADGYVLIDFGSTRAAVGATGNTVAGTLGYMAPEQLMGKATPASDVYGLAATAVALLANADASELIDAHDPGAWRNRVTVSQGLGDLLEEMLAVKPNERPTIKSLRKKLETGITALTVAPKRSRRDVEKAVGDVENLVRSLVEDSDVDDSDDELAIFEPSRRGTTSVTTWKGALIELGRGGPFDNLHLVLFPIVIPALGYYIVDLVFFNVTQSHIGWPPVWLLALWALFVVLFLPLGRSFGKQLDQATPKQSRKGQKFLPAGRRENETKIKKFRAEIYVNTLAEKGMNSPILFTRSRMRFGHQKAFGTVHKPSDSIAMPKNGETYECMVTLNTEVSASVGDSFKIVNSNRVIGVGSIVKVFE